MRGALSRLVLLSSAGCLRPGVAARSPGSSGSGGSSLQRRRLSSGHRCSPSLSPARRAPPQPPSVVAQGRLFEEQCGRYLQRVLGCTLTQAAGKSGDGGVDLYGDLPSASGIRFIVQCKDHKRRQGAHELRALEAVLARHQILGPHVALFVTPKRVSEAAKTYVETSTLPLGCLVLKDGLLQEARLNKAWFKLMPKTELRSRMRPDGQHECVLLLDRSA